MSPQPGNFALLPRDVLYLADPREHCSKVSTEGPEPYGDISGTGVVIGFVGTGYLLLALLIANYLLAFDPENNPFRPISASVINSDTTQTDYWRPNTTDVTCLKWFRGTCKAMLLRVPTFCAWNFWTLDLEKVFGEAIINICDIQIFAGAGILISGFISLPSGVSAFHWRIIVYLAWFSTITHLAGLTVVRSHLHNHFWKRTIRFGLMFITFVLLVVAIVPTGLFITVEPWGLGKAVLGSPAICYFDSQFGKKVLTEVSLHLSAEGWDKYGEVLDLLPIEQMLSFESMVLSEILLFVGLLTRSVKIFLPLSKIVGVKLRRPISKGAQWIVQITAPLSLCCPSNTPSQPTTLHDIQTIILFRPTLAIFITLRLCADFLSSMFFEIYWLFITLVWGTLKLMEARGSKFEQIQEEESKWTFGQILPVFLLAAPIFNIVSILVSNLERRTTRHHISSRHVDSFVMEENGDNNVLSCLLSRDNCISAPWLGVSILTCCSALVTFTIIAVCAVSGPLTVAPSIITDEFKEYGRVLVTILVERPGILWFLLFGLLPACMFTVLFGLTLEGWLLISSARQKRKTSFLFLCIGIHSSYAAVFWKVQNGYWDVTKPRNIYWSIDGYPKAWYDANPALCPLFTAVLFVLYAVCLLGYRFIGRYVRVLFSSFFPQA